MRVLRYIYIRQNIFEDFINSKEFLIDEVNRLKNKNMEDLYIKRYIYLGKNFMKFINE